MERIDVIIPAYNAQSTINDLLMGVADQTIAGRLDVTIVNDGGVGYSDVVSKYLGRLNIREIGYCSNKGRGFARQYGLEHTSNPLLVFADADDVLSGSKSIEILANAIGSSPAVFTPFAEEFDGIVLRELDPTSCHLHGKMFRRKFLSDHNIRFNPDLLINEDAAFMNLFRLWCPQEDVKIVNAFVYRWINHRLNNFKTNIVQEERDYINASLQATDWAIQTAGPSASCRDSFINCTIRFLFRYYKDVQENNNGQNAIYILDETRKLFRSIGLTMTYEIRSMNNDPEFQTWLNIVLQ